MDGILEVGKLGGMQDGCYDLSEACDYGLVGLEGIGRGSCTIYDA